MVPTSVRVLALASLLAPLKAGDTIKIAVTGPFTGGSASLGISNRDGAKLAAAEINAAGGIRIGKEKRLIEVIERDDEAKNERGALIAQELSGLPELSGIIGPTNTGVMMAGARYIQEKGIPELANIAGTKPMTAFAEAGVKDLPIFRFYPSAYLQSVVIVEEALRRGCTKVAVFHDSTAFGVSGRDDLLAIIPKRGAGLQVVATEKFNIGDKDMTAQVLRAKAGGAQAILIWGVGPEMAAVANGVAKLGLKLPLIGSSTLNAANFLDNAGRNGDGSLMPVIFLEGPSSPFVAAFLEHYHRTFKVDHLPAAGAAATGYDSMRILAAAVQQAQSTDPHRVKEALEDLKAPVQGVIKLWKHPFSRWNPAREETHEAFRSEDLCFGIVKDGKVDFAREADRERMAKLGAARP